MTIKLIVTIFLIAVKIFVIVNFILKYRKMIKRVEFLERENETLTLSLKAIASN